LKLIGGLEVKIRLRIDDTRDPSGGYLKAYVGYLKAYVPEHPGTYVHFIKY
jgi:hypothetical protein